MDWRSAPTRFCEPSLTVAGPNRIFSSEPTVPTLIRVPRGRTGDGAAMPQFVPRPGASSARASGLPSIRASAPAAILLIVAALDLDDLYELHREARGLDLDVVVEVHDEEELEHALDIDADVLGLNNRDLGDFSVDLERTYELLSDVPAGKTVVSESGYTTREQLEDLDRVGVDAVLIGETLMRARDVEAACRGLAAGHERHFES